MEELCMHNKQNSLRGLKLFSTFRCQQSTLEDIKILSSAESVKESKFNSENLTALIADLK